MFETISALRIRLEECETRPADILAPFKPKKVIRYAWIPQTLGDQIWVLYGFVTEKERIEWETTLPEKISKWLDRTLILQALSYRWRVRDLDGF